MVYVKTGDFARAYEQFSRAVEIEPPNLKYRIAAARALFDKGDTLGAAREYEKIPVGKDNDPAVMAARTVVYEKLVEQYTARVKASPGNKEYYFALGVFYSKLSRYSEALTAFETTWKLDRTRFDALFNMAVTAELLGDQPRARDAYAELVKRAAADNKFRKLAEAKLAVR
jgi:tetratricopeptide (TPR) repeat protein